MQYCRLSVLLFLLAAVSSSFSIRLENNGYRDVLVAINRDLPEDQSLIQTIKQLITDASPVLFRATRKRSYFEQVTILVPETWSDSNDYKPATAKETFAKANVRINPPEVYNGRESNSAFVESIAVCGEPGLYMHITPKRMTDPRWTNFSPAHKMFVHEWGHLRWGIFDEYYQSFYGPDFNGVPARCVEKVKPQWSGEKWKFTTNGTVAAIMWQQYRSDVVEFCDDSDDAAVKHYRKANNAQNRYCDMKSSWGVMNETEDFKDGRNLPKQGPAPAPVFTVVRKKSLPSIVLALDVSNSMSRRPDTILNLRQAATKYINEVVLGSRVGIVHFNNVSTIKRGLTEITGSSSRKKLLKKLPTSNDLAWETSIGGAILTSLKVLRQSSNQRKQLVIISDGSETHSPKIMDKNVQESIELSGVQIHTIGIGKQADGKLSFLSKKTGGTSFFYDETSDDKSGLQDAITTLLEESSDDSLHQVSRQKITIANKSSETATVYFDDGIGHDSVFNFFWTSKEFSMKKLKISVRSPKNKIYRQNKLPFECDATEKTCRLKVSGVGQEGMWTITFQNKDRIPLTLTWESFSREQPNAVDPIKLTTHISQSHVTFPQPVTISATLMRGTRPIIDAYVTAVITRPSGEPAFMHLLDNGAGSDLIAFDGLYSATFTNFSGAGFYNVKVIASQAFTNNQDFVNSREDLKTKKAGVGVRFIYDDLPPEGSGITQSEPSPGVQKDTLPPFSRIQSPGMFTVTGYRAHEDAIAPSRIIDLKASVEKDYTTELTWTAPGDDMDNDKASAYSIRFSTSFDDLVDDFTNQAELMPKNLLSSKSLLGQPRMGGLKERAVFLCPLRADMVFVAIKTRDKSGLWSGLSNVVNLTFSYSDGPIATCNCKPKPSLEKAICKHNFVMVGTVSDVTNKIVRFHPGAEFLKPRMTFTPALFSQVKMDITRTNSNGCLCPLMPQPGQAYVMSGIINTELRINNKSYLQPAPTDMAQFRQEVASILSSC